MKKKSMLLVGVLILTIIFSLVGCGKDGYDEDSDSEDEKITYTDLDWPESDIVKTIPVPKSKKGYANWESSDGYNVNIINMTKEDCNNYIKKCQKAGYIVDYKKNDGFYSAEDKSGNYLRVEFRKDDNGKQVMHLSVVTKDYYDDDDDAPDTSASNTNNTDVSESEVPSSSSGSSSADKSNIRPDVKKALDSYEKFMNKYVSFMKKYSESDDTTSMMKDYNSYMKKYADFTKKFKKLKDKKLNDDELAYYMEVESRVADKLATIE